jgi:pimeloyl-ACP methyl ester carboxylesterase
MRPIEFPSGDSEIVRGALFEPGDGRPHPAIIFAHGFLSRREEFGDYPEKFCARGYVALAIDFRGHGASAGMRGLISQERMVEDLRRGLDFIDTLPNVDKNRIALFGHSLGGGGVICAAAQDARARAVVASATVCNVLDEVGRGEMLLYRFIDAVNSAQKAVTRKSLYVPYRVTYKDIFADPQARERAAAKKFLQTSTPADNLRLLMKQDTEKCARQLRVPVLVARAELDRVVKRESARRVYDAIPSEKDWYEIPGSGHSFATDGANEVAFEYIGAWLDQKTK